MFFKHETFWLIKKRLLFSFLYLAYCFPWLGLVSQETLTLNRFLLSAAAPQRAVFHPVYLEGSFPLLKNSERTVAQIIGSIYFVYLIIF